MVQAEDRDKINIQSIEDYENVFKTYYKGLCRYACTWIDNKEDAEEIVQSIFFSNFGKKEKTESLKFQLNLICTKVYTIPLSII